ncbi:hypothetical protein P23p27 [Thermus phage P23-45]|uniref:Uncharacterized protein n=2 Tax=Oshimavirus TaxID=1623293 RepID=A7XX50_BP234|nr:hypothetical protein P23p27 [Thermus phage P23-45]YP_001467995.1 hypothetical protein P74p25 [Thermus phage P74-26]ABU96860.1 hypothetical protein P23p27 [Thermus phage P23-45]ABU96975.1 hypothetical protein P74p25 [Thermus phage P74-26]
MVLVFAVMATVLIAVVTVQAIREETDFTGKLGSVFLATIFVFIISVLHKLAFSLTSAP